MESLLEEVELRLQKRSIVDSLRQLMDRQHIGPTELARRMDTSRYQINRLLDPGDVGINLRTLDKVTKALDARFHVVIGAQIKKRSVSQRRRARREYEGKVANANGGCSPLARC